MNGSDIGFGREWMAVSGGGLLRIRGGGADFVFLITIGTAGHSPWLVARATFCGPQSLAAPAAAIAFAALLATQLAPRLSAAAKEWRMDYWRTADTPLIRCECAA